MNMTVSACPSQPAAASFSWLVSPGKASGFAHETFTTLCSGHAAIGRVLGYLVYKASHAVTGQQATTPGKQADIVVCCKQQEITTQAAVSLASLSTYLKQLVAWGYLSCEARRQQYTLHLGAIEQATRTPPAPLPIRPRGKNATAPRASRATTTEPLPDLSPSSPVDRIAQATNDLLTGEGLLTLEVTELLNLGNELLNLEVRFLNLEVRFLNLEVSETCEPASQVAAEGLLEGYRTYREEEEKITTSSSSLETREGADAPSAGNPVEPTERAGAPLPEKKLPRCSSRTIRESIDALRGYALEQEGPIKNERKLIKGWCEQHPLEDFQAVISHLTHGTCSNQKHQWWREQGRLKTYFNASKLVELTPDILAELGRTPTPVMPPEVGQSQQQARQKREEARGGYQPHRGAMPLASLLRPEPAGAGAGRGGTR